MKVLHGLAEPNRALLKMVSTHQNQRAQSGAPKLRPARVARRFLLTRKRRTMKVLHGLAEPSRALLKMVRIHQNQRAQSGANGIGQGEVACGLLAGSDIGKK